MRTWMAATAAGISLLALSQWMLKEYAATSKTAAVNERSGRTAAHEGTSSPLASGAGNRLSHAPLTFNLRTFTGETEGTAVASPFRSDMPGRWPDRSSRPASAKSIAPFAASMTAAGGADETRAEAPSLFGISLGETERGVLAALGQPSRREPAAFGYEWLIFNQAPARYVQVGIANGRVVDVYSNAPLAQVGRIGIGTSLQALGRTYPIEPAVRFSYQGADVTITNQPDVRPLFLIGDAAFITYLDRNNDSKVTALRLMDKRVLLEGGFYETKWTYEPTGPAFDSPPLTIKEREAVNQAYARQLLDLANVVRYRYRLPLLTWNEQVAAVAMRHSQDMETDQFFDHVSPQTGLGPFERLKQAGISYRMAGENIAAGYPDAIEAHESWMNSAAHRQNILEKGFTQLGAGVYADFYTQNFVTPR